MATPDTTEAAAPAPASAPPPAPGLRAAASPAVGLAVGAGAALSVQAFVNGRFGVSLGSAELAGVISLAISLVTVIAITASAGTLGRAYARVRAGARPRWWHLVVCANGALVLIVSAEGAPKVGVALLTVAIVCGQIAGGLIVDFTGMSPAGRRPLTTGRALGIALALVAVALAALGHSGDLHLGLLALAVAAGTSISLHQAALGHLSRIAGDPVVAAGVTFTISGLAAVVAWLVLDGGSVPSDVSAPPLEWIGGVAGIVVVVSMARAVARLGVLELALGVVAGQAVGALVIDAVAPAAGGSVTLRTVISAALTVLAVLVSGMAIDRRSRPWRTS